MKENTTLDEMIAHAGSLVPELRLRRPATDELRALPEESVQAIKDNGIIGATTPTELGGTDLGAAAIFEIGKELGRGCAATAWVAGNWAVHSTLAAMFPLEAQAELFSGQPSGLPTIATGFSPLRAKTELVAGGARISGQWDFVSGVRHSDWVVVQAMTDQGPLAHLIPSSDFTILDTWNTTGLRGSGSNDITGQDIFVPEHRLLYMGKAADGNSVGADKYGTVSLRLPLAQIFSSGILGTLAGCALGGLDAFLTRTSENIGGLTGLKVATRPEVQLKLGRACADIDAALAFVRSTYVDMENAAAASPAFTLSDRVRWRRDIAWAAQTLTGALTSMYEIAGAHSLYRGDPLEQVFRDGIAASHHFAFGWDQLYVGYGKVMMGDNEPGIVML